MAALTLRIGRRGAILILLGAMWVFLGLAVLLGGSEYDPNLPHTWLPLWVRTGGWVATGVIAIVCGFVKPHGRDWPGFVSLYLMPAERAVSFLAGVVILDYPFERGLLGWALYTAIVALVVITAGWPEPSHRELS